MGFLGRVVGGATNAFEELAATVARAEANPIKAQLRPT
jgi:hypothetical protein